MKTKPNEKISIVICSKNSYNDVLFHLQNTDSYKVGEVLFVTNCKDEINVITKHIGKYKTPISLVQDDGTGVGQARAKGLAKVTKEYLIFLGPDNRIDSDSITKIFNQLNSLDFKALSFSQKIYHYEL